jgi:ABC-2 type transport system permease protein
VSVIISVLGGILITIFATLVYDAHLPESPGLLIPAFVISVLGFTSFGVLLGAIMPTTRAAQALGLILFFVMFILAGAGPPREVMTDIMQTIGDVTPLRYAILTLQDPWLGFGWNFSSSLILGGIILGTSLLSLRLFRWE